MAGKSGDTRATFSAIIVTHNSAAVVVGLLATLPQDMEIVCVDNASEDDVTAAVAGRPVKLVQNSTNLGYGAACNRGAAVATGEYLFFMNPDIKLAADAVPELQAAIARYPDCAAFSPHIEDDNGRVENRDHNFIERIASHRLMRLRAPFAGDCCVHFLHGGALVIRRETFLALGGFDEKMFLYYEDDDLAVRLLRNRQVIVYVHAAFIRHGVQRSSTPTFRRRYEMNRHKKRSEIYIRRKYGFSYSRLGDVADHCLRVVVYAATLNPFRLAGAAGRLAGALSREEAESARQSN